MKLQRCPDIHRPNNRRCWPLKMFLELFLSGYPLFWTIPMFEFRSGGKPRNRKTSFSRT